MEVLLSRQDFPDIAEQPRHRVAIVKVPSFASISGIEFMPCTTANNLLSTLTSSAASAFSFCVAAASVLGQSGLTNGSNRSLRSLGPAKAGPLAKR